MSDQKFVAKLTGIAQEFELSDSGEEVAFTLSILESPNLSLICTRPLLSHVSSALAEILLAANKKAHEAGGAAVSLPTLSIGAAIGMEFLMPDDRSHVVVRATMNTGEKRDIPLTHSQLIDAIENMKAVAGQLKNHKAS